MYIFTKQYHNNINMMAVCCTHHVKYEHIQTYRAKYGHIPSLVKYEHIEVMHLNHYKFNHAPYQQTKWISDTLA